MSYTYTQKIARPVINFLVERYFPNGLFFFGDGPLKAFDRIDKEGSFVGRSASIVLAKIAHDNNASSLTVEAECVSINSDDIGDWRITVERLRDPQ